MIKEKKRGKTDTEVAVSGNRLLVIGLDIGFSEMLIDYSLDMAQRMEYSIVAVNLYAYQNVWTLFSESTIKVADVDELKKERESAAEIFAKKAKNRKIGFSHLCRVGELDDVAMDICNEQEGGIDLILVEPEYLKQPAEGPRSIPAFTFAPREL